MSADYSTHRIEDAEISAMHDTYPDDLDRPTRADIEEEAEWFRHFKARTDAIGADPHHWPREHEGSLLDALRAALCDLCGVHAATDHGLCKSCAAFLRDEGAGQ